MPSSGTASALTSVPLTGGGGKIGGTGPSATDGARSMPPSFM
jgi:hypothetical protein